MRGTLDDHPQMLFVQCHCGARFSGSSVVSFSLDICSDYDRSLSRYKLSNLFEITRAVHFSNQQCTRGTHEITMVMRAIIMVYGIHYLVSNLYDHNSYHFDYHL